MADIALVTANRVEVVSSKEQMTLPAAEAIVAGQAMRLDVSTGRFALGNGTLAAEARVKWIAVKTVQAGEPVTGIKVGILDGFDLSGMAYDDDVFLSDTDGALADAAGTVSVVVGRVIPGTAVTLGSGYSKLLMVDL